jgi:hypothetical protein
MSQVSRADLALAEGVEVPLADEDGWHVGQRHAALKAKAVLRPARQGADGSLDQMLRPRPQAADLDFLQLFSHGESLQPEISLIKNRGKG